MSEKIGLDARFVPRRRYNVQALWEKHHEILRQVVMGRSNGEIASVIGCTPQTVSNLRNSPIAKAEIERLSDGRDEAAMNVAQRIEAFAPIALDLIENIVRGREPSASIALRAKLAGGQLARAGYGEVRKVQALHAHLSKEDIDNIKARAMDAARVAGVMTDVEFHDAT